MRRLSLLAGVTVVVPMCLLAAAEQPREAARRVNPYQTVSSGGEPDSKMEASVDFESVRSFRGTFDKLTEKKAATYLAAHRQETESAKELWSLVAREPASNTYRPETIIGPDSRIRISATTTFPARAVAYIAFTMPGAGNFICTGWLINRNTVATAGHCVHSGGPGGSFVTNIRVYPGRNGRYSPFGSCAASSLYTVAGWANSGNERYDFGAIKLNCNIGQRTGWFGLSWQSATLNGQPSLISGYPGDKPLTQWKSSDRIGVSSPQMLFYRNDSLGGMSGSPVYNSRASCGRFCAMAIHTAGLHGPAPHGTHNHGVRITQNVFESLIRWRNVP
jgi:glutamyl endopeptidase